MRIGRRYWGVALAMIPDHLSHKAPLLKYVERLEELRAQGTGLLLWGDNDGGKSAAAVAVLKEARRRGYTGLFVTAVSLREAYYNGEEYEPGVPVIRRAAEVDFLVIDDFGKEYQGKSDHHQRVLEDLIRRRSNDLKVTILTANPDPKTWAGEGYHSSLLRLLTGCMVNIQFQRYSWRAQEYRKAQQLLGV